MADVSSAFDVAERYWAKGAPVDVQGIISDLGIQYAEETRPDSMSGLSSGMAMAIGSSSTPHIAASGVASPPRMN
jgi:hypothetical protein